MQVSFYVTTTIAQYVVSNFNRFDLFAYRVDRERKRGRERTKKNVNSRSYQLKSPAKM